MADFPHCDQDVLHAPTTCQYCDMFPEKQQYRLDNSINFTDENYIGRTPCPSDAKRGRGVAHKWGGNTPKPKGCTCGYIKINDCPVHD
jgi:hypothetical protein